MINAPLQVSLPVDLLSGLQDRLRELIALHEEQVKAQTKRARVEVVPEKIMEAQLALRKTAQRMTLQHLIRALLTAGLDTKPSTLHLYRMMTEDGIVVGRPAGVKRGSRAA